MITLSSFKAELDRLRDLHGFPGMTAAYALADGTLIEAASGFADLETKEPMTSQCRMLAGSIGKTFVSATVIALAKEGRLSLDDFLSSWLGDYKWYSRLPNHQTITLRHLLNHSSGLPDHTHNPGFLTDLREPFSPESLIEKILDHPPLFEAGKSWAYTDTGYILLGIVIEIAAKNSYYEEIKKRFLKPIGLKETAPSDRKILPGLAAGYTEKENRFGLPRKILSDTGELVWNPIWEWTGGGLISSSKDLALWAKTLYEGRAIGSEYLSELFQGVAIGTGLKYGLGLLIAETDSWGLKLGHGGMIPGYVSSMRYYPKYRTSIAFQINADASHAVNEIESRLLEFVLKRDDFC